MDSEQKKQERQIIKHGINLNKIFKTDHGNIELCKLVRRREVKAHQLATDYCNGLVTCEQWEVKTAKILDSLDKLLNFRKQQIPVFINGDCRGYALKIEDSYVRDNELNIFRDFGGYGIIAPEITGKG